MKERPILFSAPMVRAILDGRKTQTRRVIKQQPKVLNNGHWYVPFKYQINWIFNYVLGDKVMAYAKFPYGKVGDRLWVRETWAKNTGSAGGCLYRADHDGCASYTSYNLTSGITTHAMDKWKPSIHMPRWASRIDLEITGVRVERLNEISEKDAEAEGVVRASYPDDSEKYRLGFRKLWESIYGAGSWQKNPWVWVIEFKRI